MAKTVKVLLEVTTEGQMTDFLPYTKLILDLLGHSRKMWPNASGKTQGGRKTVANMAQHDSTAQRWITFSATFIRFRSTTSNEVTSCVVLSSNLNGCPPWQQDSATNTPSIISRYDH